MGGILMLGRKKMKDLIKFILFVISLALFLIGVIIDDEIMVYYGFSFSILSLLFLDEDRIEKIVDSHRGIPFIIAMIMIFIGCILHNHRLVGIAGSAIIFLNLKVEKEND